MPSIDQKITLVLNKNFGGYGLSRAASEEIARRKGIKTRIEQSSFGDSLLVGDDGWDSISDVVRRDDQVLVDVVREMGKAAGRDLRIVEITVTIEINDNDGYETVDVHGYEF